MLAQIVPVVGTVCSFKQETSKMDPKCDVEESSYPLPSREPISASVISPSMNSITQEISSSKIPCGALDSISLLEISEQRDDEANDNDRLDNTVGMRCHDNVCSSPPRRSARVTKLNQKNLSTKAAKGCGEQIPKTDILDLNWKVERKARSCRRARSSIWRFGGLSKYFEKSTSEVIMEGSKKSEKGRGARGKGKEKRDQAVTGLKVSNGNASASFGRLRFKVKLGKETGQTFPTDLQNIKASGIENCEVAKFSVLDSCEEVLGVRGTQGCDEDFEKVIMSSEALDICPKNDMESSVTGEKLNGFVANKHQGIPSPVDVQGPGVSVDNKYLDLGTSPDSEVINLTPEAQFNGKEQEEFHDVQISSQSCEVPTHIASLNLSCESGQKGKISDKTLSICNFNMQDRIDKLGNLDNDSVLVKCRKERNPEDGLVFNEASVLTATANLSRNASSSDGPGELFPSSVVGDMGTRLPCTKLKGKRTLKNSLSKQRSKGGPEVSESPKGKKGNACRQKRNGAKSNGKRRVRNKTASGMFARTAMDYQDTVVHVGNTSLDVSEKAKTGDGSLAQENIDIDVLHKDAPAQCVPPRNAWVLCDECSKWRRIPAILADSINETDSRWTCKENVDRGFDDCSIPQEKSNSEINAELDISDAEDFCDDGVNPEGSQTNPFGGQEQSSWRLIRSNKFMHRSRKSQTIDDIMVCNCKPPTNGKLGCVGGCLNRMLNIECVRGTCPCGEQCSNQQFQKRKYAKLKWFRCGKKGYGLQLLEDISEGEFLIEYIGEVLDMQAYKARQRDYASQGHKHFYFMTLNGSEVIDACAKGNLGRFINHSCDPNCRTEKWMVNGEVCIGLFAMKDLKKGDEVTFDYNYVRVFGAAAKKCVCGSSLCQGYIGGDPRNSEVIVQGDSDDEFPEPVMVYDEGEVDDNLKKLISTTNVSDDAKASLAIANHVPTYEDNLERNEPVFEHLEGTKELRLGDVLVNDDKTDESANDASCRKTGTEKLQIALKAMEKSAEAWQPFIQKPKSSSELDTDSVNTISDSREVILSNPEVSASTVVKKKSLSDSCSTKGKHKSDRVEDKRAPKSKSQMKISRVSSSVKKGKSCTSNSGHLNKPETVLSKSHGPSYKSKKIIEDSAIGRFEVEDKLNQLLDVDGGISKKQNAVQGYLKLLFLTAASGDSVGGEAIQSNRELSLILGAIWKTKSRSVLVEVISKNGLQMLHNILKRCRRDFTRIPILRKLLKVLEFLAGKEILTIELINRDPACAGVESFRESILSLSEHADKQVHRIARNFRDMWIPRSLRRIRGFNSNRNSSPNHWREQSPQTRDAFNGNRRSILTTDAVSIDAIRNEGSSPTSMTGSRKRKSRWDQPTDSNKEQKFQHGFECMITAGQDEVPETRADDEEANMDEDIPPGFGPPQNVSSVNQGKESFSKVELCHPQEKFLNRLAVSYGIPMPIMQQLGYPKTDGLEDWFIAPGVPFQPYPPLPTYSQNTSDDARNHLGHQQPVQSDHNLPSTYGFMPSHDQGTNSFQEAGGSNVLGRYFRQQECNSSGLPPPWKRRRFGWGFRGNDSRRRMCRSRNDSEDGINIENHPKAFTQNAHQGYY